MHLIDSHHCLLPLPPCLLLRLPAACLQESGDAFLQCLQLALEAAPSMPQALQVLAGYEQAVRLAALLRVGLLGRTAFKDR